MQGAGFKRPSGRQASEACTLRGELRQLACSDTPRYLHSPCAPCRLHDRMPVLLPTQQAQDAWLGTGDPASCK